eukprot:g10027.t1
MFRAISSRTALFTTTVESRKHQHRHCAHACVMAGRAASIGTISTPTLNRPHSASWNLAGLADTSNSASVQLSAGFRARNRQSVFQDTARNLGGSPGHGDIDGLSACGSGSFFSRVGTEISEIFSALTSPKHATLVFRRGGVVDVPRGQPDSEAEWASLETGRNVTCNRRVGRSFFSHRGETVTRLPLTGQLLSCPGTRWS